MSNITITNNNLSNVLLKDAQFQDCQISFLSEATLQEGTILAVDSLSKDFVPFVKGGTANENGIPKAILTYELFGKEPEVPVFPFNQSARVAISGTFRKELLVIDADGDGSNVDQTVLDQLRDYGLVPDSVQELNYLDNQ
jgi:hypothetical protein